MLEKSWWSCIKFVGSVRKRIEGTSVSRIALLTATIPLQLYSYVHTNFFFRTINCCKRTESKSFSSSSYEERPLVYWVHLSMCYLLFIFLCLFLASPDMKRRPKIWPLYNKVYIRRIFILFSMLLTDSAYIQTTHNFFHVLQWYVILFTNSPGKLGGALKERNVIIFDIKFCWPLCSP